MNPTRRAVILPVVLLILILLGLLTAMFSFRINADLSSTQVLATQLQTRLAAEAGVERVKLLLRSDRGDMSQWYDNPDELHRSIVWSHDGDSSVWGTTDELNDDTAAFRFSIVADDPTDDLQYFRFGITDESSKVHLNQATEEQLFTLVAGATADDEEADPQQIVDAILDWRDSDRTPRGDAGDTEGDYYKSLVKPYLVKNGPFDTVEELLLVKGVTGQVLYGEDIDRNGLLTLNEDDGDASFPPDNQDGHLNRGIYPYLTVMSFENNVSNDQRPRVYLLGEEALIREQLAEDFEGEPEVLDYIIATARGGQGSRGPGSGGGNRGQGSTGGRVPSVLSPGQSPPGGNEGDPKALLPIPDGGPASPGVRPSGGRRAQPPGGAADESGNKDGARKQRRQGNPEEETKQPAESSEAPPQPARGGRAGRLPRGLQPQLQEGSTDAPREGQKGEGQPQPGEGAGTGGVGEPNTANPAETNDGRGAAVPMRGPASLFLERTENGQPAPSPLRPEHLPILMDRTTVIPSDQPRVTGLINVNTAPRDVLRCIKDLTDEQIEAIVDRRDALSAEAKATTAWLVTEEAIDLQTFERIAPYLTARGQQFTIESLGYGDHVGMVTRLQVVVDMVGPIAQTIYYRDLTYLGGHFPIREKDGEHVRVR